MGILKQRFDFGRRERKCEAVKAVTLERMRTFLRDVVRPASMLTVEVQSIAVSQGKDAPTPPGNASEQTISVPDRVWLGNAAAQAFRQNATWVARPTETAPPTVSSKL